MLPRSGIYYAAQHMHHAKRVTLPPVKTSSDIRPASYHEELGVFLRLWFVILAGVAVIMLGSWLATS